MAGLRLALLCALWAAAGGSAERRHGKCGKPKDIENAVLEDDGSMRLRYSCVKDYKRKAGTSSLIVCKENQTTKEFQWSDSNLNCIRDPSKPFPEAGHTTEDTRKESEAPTPSRQPAPPKTSAKPEEVSRDPHGSEAASAPNSSTATTLLWMTAPSPGGPATMETPQETGGGISGTDPKNVKLHKGMAMQDAQPENSTPSFRTLSTEAGSTTAIPSRNTPENTTWLSKMDIPHGQAGSFHLQAMLLPVGLIVLPCVIAGLWCFCRKHGLFQRQTVVEEISMAEISEERGRMILADPDLEDVGPADEGTPVQLTGCATSNG